MWAAAVLAVSVTVAVVRSARPPGRGGRHETHTKKPAPDPDRAPDLGEGRDHDLVCVVGAPEATKPTPDPDPDPPRTLRGPGPCLDLACFFASQTLARSLESGSTRASSQNDFGIDLGGG